MASAPKKDPQQKPGSAQSTTTEKPSKSPVITRLCLILALLSCLLYANTFKNDYAFDDVMMITDNIYVQQGLAGVPTLITTPQMRGYTTNLASDKYRPLALVMFAIEYHFFGLNPTPGHVINVLLFAACVVLLFLFLHKLFNGAQPVVAFVAALLFAVHPVHVEVVANIKSRDELLCFLFAFLSLNAFIRYTEQGKRTQLLLGAFYLFMAYIAKETAVTFLGIIPLVFFAYCNSNRKASWHITLASVAVFAIFIAIRTLVLYDPGARESIEIRLVQNLLGLAPDGVTRLATEVQILGRYLKLLVIPYPLVAFYSFNTIPFVTFANVTVWLSIAIYGALAFFSIKWLRGGSKNPWSFAILFYVITISLFSNFFFLIGEAFAERFAFFPSAGFCLAVALAFHKWILKAPATDFTPLKSVRSLAVLAPVVLLFSTITIARNTDWKDNYTLMTTDVQKAPDDSWMHYYAALEMQKRLEQEQYPVTQKEMNKESLAHFLRSLAIYPDNSEAHADIAVAYMRTDNADSAIHHLKRALELNPIHLNAATNLATILYKKQQFGPAISYYKRALQVNPHEETALYNMSMCYAQIHQADSAITCLKKVMEVAPQFNDYKAFPNAAILYKAAGNTDSARRYEQLTRQYYPGFSLERNGGALL